MSMREGGRWEDIGGIELIQRAGEEKGVEMMEGEGGKGLTVEFSDRFFVRFWHIGRSY